LVPRLLVLYLGTGSLNAKERREVEEEGRGYHTREGLNCKEMRGLTKATGGLLGRAENRAQPVPSTDGLTCLVVYQSVFGF